MVRMQSGCQAGAGAGPTRNATVSPETLGETDAGDLQDANASENKKY